MNNIIFISFITIFINSCVATSDVKEAYASNEIISSKISYQDKYKVFFEVEYVYDGTFGDNANIIITPISDIPHWSHESIKALKGRNKVNVKVEHPNWGSAPKIIPVTHAEIALRVTSYSEIHKTNYSEKITSIIVELQHEFNKK